MLSCTEALSTSVRFSISMSISKTRFMRMLWVSGSLSGSDSLHRDWVLSEVLPLKVKILTSSPGPRSSNTLVTV